MRLEKKRMNVKGQITIFIIIAVVVVAIGLLIYFFLPKLKSTVETAPTSPSEYIRQCMQDGIEQAINTISLQGGELNPKLSYPYENHNVGYLCYTTEYYKPCIVQQAMLVQHIQNETRDAIINDSKSCFNSMVESYKNKGYDVTLKKSLEKNDIKVELLPNKVVVNYNEELTLTKGSTQNYNAFEIDLDNNLYDLAGIANSITYWEAEYGDAPVDDYMVYYPNMKVEKYKQIDGTTIYILTDTKNGGKLEFASRSVVFPPGY